MKIHLLIVSTSLLLTSGAANVFAGEDRDIDVAEVPAIVLAAAENAAPGFRVDAAEIEIENGVEVYELEGEVDGQEIEIEVSAAGEVLEIELDD